jgi:hypothetical protein
MSDPRPPLEAHRPTVLASGGRSPAPPALPGRGRLRVMGRLLQDPTPVLDEIGASGLPVVAMGRGPLRTVVVADPDLVHDVFTMPPSRFRWSHPLNVLRFVVGPQSLLVSDGEDHRRRRSAVVPALARRKLDRWVPAMVAVADEAVHRLLAEASRRRPRGPGSPCPAHHDEHRPAGTLRHRHGRPGGRAGGAVRAAAGLPRVTGHPAAPASTAVHPAGERTAGSRRPRRRSSTPRSRGVGSARPPTTRIS